MKDRELRNMGIHVIGDVPWGTHSCLFYHTKEDLIDILVPYFKAGLENNEFCMWVTSEPLKVEDARKSLRKAVKNLDKYIEKGQMEILDYSQWYTKTGKFDAERVLKGWVGKEQEAFKRGFDGLRLTGNTFWLEKEDWKDFFDYEAKVDSIIGQHRMMALCTYSLDKCGVNEVLDVTVNHEFALIKREGKWGMIQGFKAIQLKEQLKDSVSKWRSTFDAIKDAVSLIDVEGKIVLSNRAMSELLGKPFHDIIGRTCWELIHGTSEPIPGCPIVRMKETRQRETLALKIKDRWFEVTADPILDESGGLNGAIHTISDITERKRAEDALKESEHRISDALEFNNSILKTSSIGVLTYDAAGQCVFANEAAAEIAGTNVAGLLLQNFHQVRSWKKTGMYEAALRALNTNIEQYTEVHVVTTFGKDVWLSLRFSSFHSRGEKHLLVFTYDITERKQAEEALKDSEEQYRLLFNNVSDAVFVHEVSPDASDPGRFRCVEVNDNACRYLGYSREELLQMSVLQIDAPETLENIPKILKKLFTEKRATWEGIHVSKDGRRIPVEISIQLFELYGKPMVLSSARDITERKQMEEQIRDSHKMRVLGQLAAGVAHEVRNPLNAILAITEALFQDIRDNPEYLPYLEHMRNQVNRLSILMKDLLEIGKPISQDSSQPETVAGIVTSTINLWGMLDLSKKCALRYISHPESEKLHVKTEIARLQQVVLNILQNAAQNSPEGSEIAIHVLEPTGKTVNVRIIDRGTGIPPDNMNHVFEPFFTTQKGGTGLGLSIVKDFVGSMGGEAAIWNNDPPPGCTVELRLPIATDSES